MNREGSFNITFLTEVKILDRLSILCISSHFSMFVHTLEV